MTANRFFWLFFSFTGRIDRSAFFLSGLLMAVVQSFLLYRFTLAPEESVEGERWAMVFSIVFFASLWSYIALGAKRFHDFDKPGLLSASLFLPVISIVVFIVLCFYPGDAGPNRYGPMPNRHPDAE